MRQKAAWIGKPSLVWNWPERDEPDPCPCVGSQGQTGNGRGAAKSTRMEQTKFIAYDLSGIEG